MNFIIEIIKNKCWVAEWDGDPGRTTIKNNAEVFPNFNSAKIKLNKIKKQVSHFRNVDKYKIIKN